MQAEAAIRRSRSLFGDSPAPDSAAADAGAMLRQAMDRTSGTAAQMGELSGLLADNHRSFADRAAGLLGAAAGTDTTLDGYLGQAAQLTRSGAARLDGIADRIRALAQAAATAKTPAAQRAVVAELNSLLGQARDVVTASQQQAAHIATATQALSYHDLPQSPQTGGPSSDIR
jgi:Domain of unknown function (DUF4226)